MARVRNWDPRVYAEVFIRLEVHNQPVRRVAQAVEMSHMQVRHFKEQLDADRSKLPFNRTMPSQELINSMEASLVLTIPNEAKPRGPGRPPKPKITQTPEEAASYQSEVEGCIDLAKQIALAYPGVSARRFLHDCIADARSA